VPTRRGSCVRGDRSRCVYTCGPAGLRGAGGARRRVGRRARGRPARRECGEGGRGCTHVRRGELDRGVSSRARVHAASKAESELERGPVVDAVSIEKSGVLELLASENDSLFGRRNARPDAESDLQSADGDGSGAKRDRAREDADEQESRARSGGRTEREGIRRRRCGACGLSIPAGRPHGRRKTAGCSSPFDALGGHLRRGRVGRGIKTRRRAAEGPSKNGRRRSPTPIGRFARIDNESMCSPPF
jgi:hypothetical protein